jgi:hypothetical protein
MEELFVVACNLNAEILDCLAGDGRLWLWIDGQEVDVGVRGVVARVGVGVERDTLLYRAAERLTSYMALCGGDVSGFFGE